ncbi:cysteine desulfurase [Candidatus Saccharibacteria bacterium]|nr:cysteine desulfurase [Candidatus Saccharibacteria bacterium]
MDNELVYLDHAAATPLDDRVFAAMQPYFSKQFFNPSSPYAPAVQVRRDYEHAKHRLAMCIGGKADDIVITAGATESIGLIFGSVSGHVVSTAIEHQAVLAAATQHDYTFVTTSPYGVVSAKEIAGAIQPNTQLVSVGLANNELGTIQPLREIATVVRMERQRRFEAGDQTPLYFHTDASQGVGQIDVHVARLGVDAITINAAKIYGPKQVALLWAANHVKLAPYLLGGGQERGLRSGTENVAGVIGFATALELATAHRNYEAIRLAALRNRLQIALCTAFPQAIVTGHIKKRLSGHLHIAFPGIDAERLVFALETKGVMVATGSACAANKGTRSHVLTAIGMEPAVADGSLRLTLGRLTDEQTIERAVAILVEVIHSEYTRSSR